MVVNVFSNFFTNSIIAFSLFFVFMKLCISIAGLNNLKKKKSNWKKKSYGHNWENWTRRLFIHSFYQLLKLRYNQSVDLSIQTNSKYNEFLLPPLTLQFLVENAVKHNVTSKEQPLQISILVTDEARLIVKNNLQTTQPNLFLIKSG